jgi:transcriptional regulator with XRE-family HTH domain
VTEEGGSAEAYLQAVGLRIRLFRLASALSQEDLARAAAVSRVTLGSIERGERAASLLTYRKLAAALGRNVGDVLRDGDVLPPPL